MTPLVLLSLGIMGYGIWVIIRASLARRNDGEPERSTKHGYRALLIGLATLSIAIGTIAAYRGLDPEAFYAGIAGATVCVIAARSLAK